MTGREKLNVLQLIDNLDIGGAQEVVVTLAKYLVRMGHPTVVCALRDGPLRSDIEALGIPVVLVPERTSSVLAFPFFVADMLRIRRDLAAIVAKYEIDVVQTHLLRSLDFLVSTLRDRAGVPLVYWTFHNYNFMLRREHLTRHRWLLRPKQLAYRWLYRIVSRRVSGLIAVSSQVREAILERIGPVDRKIVVIPNGVDIERYAGAADRDDTRRELGLSPSQFAMIMVGTFKTQKGHAFLIEAAAAVLPSHPEARILLVGDGDLRPELEARTRAADLADAVTFLGSRRDVPRLLAASDCFVLPSLWEGLPMALLEAMASRLPCIATDVSGTAQVVESGVTGFLVPPGDARGLAEAAERMLAHPERTRHMGLAGHDRVESHFSAEKQAADHVHRFRADLVAVH